MTGGKIRLLLFLHDLAPFGAQRVALEIVRFLGRDKFGVCVCSFGGDETLTGEFTALGAEVVPLRASRFLDLRAWYRLAVMILRRRPDIIQTNLAELSVPVRLLALFLPGVRVVHSVQNPLSSEPWYWRILNRLTFFLCGRVVFCSESIKAEAGIGGDNISVIQNAMALGLPAPGRSLRAELGIKPGEKVACCVARLARQKGQDILLRAAALLKAEGKAVKFLLAGDGEDMERLKALAASLGIDGEIYFLGRQADVAAVYAASDIYAAPSRWEGLGISLGEAMLAGLPCAGSAIPGHADILLDGVTGLAVPPENPAALAGAIASLLDDPVRAREFAGASKAKVSGAFTYESMADKWSHLYGEVAKK